MNGERTRTQEARGPRTRARQRSRDGPGTLVESLGTQQVSETTPETATATTDAGAAVAVMEMPQTELSPAEQAAREAELAAAEEALTSAETAGGAMDAFAAAPPSVKARTQGDLGRTIGGAEETATTDFQEELPALPIRMGGEPGAEQVPAIATPATVSEGLESGTPPPPEMPELETGETQRATDPNAGLAGSASQALGDPGAVAGALGGVSTSDPGIATSPGPRPRVPLTPGSRTDPARIDNQQQAARERAGGARTEASQAVIDGPGPEQARLKEVDEERQLGEQARPEVEQVETAEGAQAFVALELPPEVSAQFDADQNEMMQAGVAESQAQVEQAESQQDTDRRTQLDEAEAGRRELETNADEEQRARVREAREEIQTERQDTIASQQEAVANLERDAEAERRTQSEAIQDRVRADEETIADTYSTAEEDAQREVETGERQADREKSAAESRSENESWWDRATSFIREAFEALTSAINAIFDAVRAAVRAVLDAARELARTLIDAAAAFISEAIRAFGELVKGLVDALLADIFPELAQALRNAIDSVVSIVTSAVDAIAETLKAGVDALVDALQAGLDAILDAFQGALNAALGILQAALTGDWGAVFERILEAVLGVLGIDPAEFYAFIAQAREALGSIIEDPGGFLRNLISAVVLGFERFAENFFTHLQSGFIAWLTGALGDIELPEEWNLRGLLDIARQVLGLTWDWVRERAARLIGEENVERLEYLFGYVATLVTEGWSALFAQVMEGLADLRDFVMGRIQEFLLINVVRAGITWLASLFSPVGAIVKAVLTIWNVYTFLRDQLARLFEIVRAVVDSIGRIVSGVLDEAAGTIEGVLARLLPVAIDFIARLIGVTGVAGRVREIIEAVRERINDAIDRLLDRVISLFRRATGSEDEEAAESPGEEAEEGSIDVGEDLRVPDPAGVDHTLSIEVRGDDAVVMMRSAASPVATWLTDFRARLPELGDEESRVAAGEAIDEAASILARLDPQADAFLDEARERAGVLDDSEVEATQKLLRDALVALFAIFGVPEDAGFELWIAAAHPLVRDDLRRALDAGAEDFRDLDWEQVVDRLRAIPPFDKPMLKSHPFGASAQDLVPAKLEAIQRREEAKEAAERLAVPTEEGEVGSFLANHLVRGINSGAGDYRGALTDLQDAMFAGGDVERLASFDGSIETSLRGLPTDERPDPDLVAAVGGGKVDQFLMAVARGDSSFGGLADLQARWRDTYWGARPNREWLKGRFRKGGGQHEWLPTNYIGEVIDRALEESDGDRAVNAERWVIFQTTFRSETKILFFSPEGDHSRTVTGLRDPEPPHDRREGAEGTETFGVLQGHVGAVYAPVGDGGYVDRVQSQTVGQGPWHDDLRGIFNRHRGAATTLAGTTAIMGDMATFADETLWAGGEHAGWGFDEYYASSQSEADGRTIDPGTLRSRAQSASGEIERTIERTRKAVLEARLP